MSGPAEVPADDRGLLLGDGLFETLLAEDGRLVDLEAHFGRLARGCQVLGLAAPSPEAAAQAMRKALRLAGLERGRAAVRLTLTAGSGRGLDRPAGTEPRLLASASPAPASAAPARLATVEARRNETSPTSRLKTLSYLDNILARREAVRAGADEALMLNTRGQLACAAAANLFWIEGDRLFTPRLDCGVLDGIVRARVIEAAAALGVQVVEIAAPRERLDGAQGLFLTNSLIGVRAVRALDGGECGAPAMIAALSSRCS